MLEITLATEIVCESAQEHIAQMFATNPDASIVYALKDSTAQDFLKVYNAFPPATTVEADKIVVLMKPGLAFGHIEFILGDCLVTSDDAPNNMIDTWVLEAKGGLGV